MRNNDPFGKYDPGIEVTATRKLPTGITFVDGESMDDNKIIKIMYEDQMGRGYTSLYPYLPWQH